MAPEADAGKRALRREMARRRREVPPEHARDAAYAVAIAAAAEPNLPRVGRVALYAAWDGELPSAPLFEAFHERRPLLPRVRDDGALEWAELERWEDLAPGRYGIPEPPGAARPAPVAGDVVFAPSLAFDERGWRLGRGGGYYDRAFPEGEEAPTLVAVGYAFQVVEAVPHDSRDRRVDAIVTERGFSWRKEGT